MINFLKRNKKHPTVNMVTESAPGWVLRWIAESYARYIPASIVSTQEDVEADINLYINYALFKKKTSIDVGYFTHREKDDTLLQRKFDEVAMQVNWCIAMSDKTAQFLPKEKTTVIHIAPDPQFHKGDIVFGVIGTEKDSGRKRYAWIPKLRKIQGITIKTTEGRLKWDEMPDFYKSIDYLLILSDNEGGPLPLLEALAMGVPVISSDVGFVDSYTTLRYSNFEDLISLIQKLIIPTDAWKTSSMELQNVLSRLWEKFKK